MRGLPDWYERRRRRALELYGAGKPAKYGPDVDLSSYELCEKGIEPLESLDELSGEELDALRKVGVREDEGFRSGTYLQYDGRTAYLKLLKDVAPDGLVVDDLITAIRRYPWLRRYWFRACPLSLDKYTAFVGAHETAGAFVWCRKGVRVEYPIQACLFMNTKGAVQVPHNVIILEPGASLHIITGCVVPRTCSRAAHVACTEIYVGEGAEFTWTMIHSWRPDTHVRPRMGAIVEGGGSLMVNYVLLSPVESIQLYPTAILLGRWARVGFRSLVLALGRSILDIGSAVIFNAEETRGEVMSRALVKGQADTRLRGNLWGRKPNVKGHLECRALLLSEKARAHAYPNLRSDVEKAELTHEAAIGRIAEEELFYLMSRGLSQDQAVALISKGFLDTDIPGLPHGLLNEIKMIVETTVERAL